MAATSSAEMCEEKAGVARKTRWAWGLVMVRLVASLATASATIVMALNKESRSFVVANVGNIPVTNTVTAHFHHTPAFIFFVIANGIATLHNWLMVAIEIFGHKLHFFKGFHFPLIAISDMLVVVLASSGDGAAIFMAALGLNGNKHTKWNKICDKFATFCDHGRGALISAFVALFLLILINAISILKLLKQKSNNLYTSPSP